jgi:hypothetical protein
VNTVGGPQTIFTDEYAVYTPLQHHGYKHKPVHHKEIVYITDKGAFRLIRLVIIRAFNRHLTRPLLLT